MQRTDVPEYTERLLQPASTRWKSLLDVQRPYRWNLKRLDLGRTLDIGCGVGRLLAHLPPGSVGLDHNATSVDYCRRLGLEAYSPQEFGLRYAEKREFDSILLAHAVEHMEPSDAREVIQTYARRLRHGGRVVIFTPQERGFALDQTHIYWVDFAEQRRMVADVGLEVEHQFSFPFPRIFGRIFRYNEFIGVARFA